MCEKIQLLLKFMQITVENVETVPKKGRPYVYPSINFLFFFIVVFVKRIHSFKGMAKYVKYNYQKFGFSKAPSRKTIRRRYYEMPLFIAWLLPVVALQISQMDERIQTRVGYIDKTVVKALGGIWHKKHMLLGVVPHPSIDTDASWAKSAYHGWRFGYGIHLIVSELRFPLAACVSTAAACDKQQAKRLMNGMLPQLYMIVGDAAYRAVRFLQQLWNNFGVFCLTFKPFETSSKFKDWYNTWLNKEEAKKVYRKRKPSVEPAFSLLKELFDLKGNSPVPFKGLKKVEPYLMVTVAAIQFMMVFNILFNNKLGESEHFKALIQ